MLQAPVPPEHYKNYISLLDGNDFVLQLKNRLLKASEIWTKLPEAKHDYAYRPDKWTVKQMLLHVCDAERIMAYRALCIVRGEKNGLPGFDENIYAEHSRYAHRELKDIWEEFELIRKSNIKMVENFFTEDFKLLGIANSIEISVESIVGVIIGHENHHTNILIERYIGGI